MSAWLFDTAVHEKTSGPSPPCTGGPCMRPPRSSSGCSGPRSPSRPGCCCRTTTGAPGPPCSSRVPGRARCELDPCSLLIFPPYVIRSSHVVGPAPCRPSPKGSSGRSRVDRPAGAEGVELLRIRIVGAPAAEGVLLPVLRFRLLHDVAQVEDARLELGRRRDPLDQVVALARGDLGRGARGDSASPM